MELKAIINRFRARIKGSVLRKVAVALVLFAICEVVASDFGLYWATDSILTNLFRRQLADKIESQRKYGLETLGHVSNFVQTSYRLYPSVHEDLSNGSYEELIKVSQGCVALNDIAGYVITNTDGELVSTTFSGFDDEQWASVSDFIGFMKKENKYQYEGYADFLNQGFCILSAHAVTDARNAIAAYVVVVQARLEDENYLKQSGEILGIVPSVFRGRMGVASAIQAGTENAGKEFPLTKEAIGDAVLLNGEVYYDVANFGQLKFLSVYVPIVDYRGAILGIYNIAIDITIINTIVFYILLSLAGLGTVIAFVLLVLTLRYFRKNLTRPLNVITKTVEQISAGDMSEKVAVFQTGDEVERLSRGIKYMHRSLVSTISDMNHTSKLLNSSSAELSVAANMLSEGANRQAASLQEISSNLEEMTGNIHQNTENAVMTDKMMELADRAVQNIGDKATENMNNTQKIAGSIRAINGLVNQTNILSLNASVEAARAGSLGRGFAVVAKEVGRLAEQTRDTAQDVSDTASKTIDGAEDINTLIDEALPQLHQVTSMLRDITMSSKEQSLGVDQINTAISNLNNVTQESAAKADEIAASAEELSRTADRLRSVVEKFKLI
jgi:methyl-accepting chemotaxis protein